MKLIVMGFDGEYKTEGSGFDSVESAWNRSNEMGSRWYFYPFHFVVTESGKTVKDASPLLDWTIGKRLKTVQNIFSVASKRDEAQGMDQEQFCFHLLDCIVAG